MSDIRWLGLDWDEGPTPEKENPSYHQSNRYSLYTAKLEQLKSMNLAYPCFCSRKDVRTMASAPHIGDAGAPYPGTCRNLSPEEVRERIRAGKKYSWRFRSPDTPYRFTDRVYGPQTATLQECGGDFNLQRSDLPHRARLRCLKLLAMLFRNTLIFRCCWTQSTNVWPRDMPA